MAEIDPKTAELVKLIVTTLHEVQKSGATDKAALRVNQPMDPKHKGTHTYIVGPSRHYRNGHLYKAGDKVTVTDERPAKDWVLADSEAGMKAVAKAEKRATAAAGRASDKHVGG